MTSIEIQAAIAIANEEYRSEMQRLNDEICQLTKAYNDKRDRLTIDLFRAIAGERDDKAMTVKEAAEYLSVSESTIRKMVNEQTIPFFKMEGAIRFSRSELDKSKRGEWISPIEREAREIMERNRRAKSVRLK